MHARMQWEEDIDEISGIVTYRTRNLFSTDGRFIHFIADQPHALKTARNCLYSSGDGNMARLMWNNGFFLMWNHISKLFYEDLACGLHWFPILTHDHIKLNPYSKMNVRLAAILSQYGPPEAKETARFCLMMDTFFDIVNIRNKDEHIHKRKPNLKPIIYSADDARLSWLTSDFLGYFENWLKSIEERPGNYDKTAKGKMFISWQTYESLKITVHSIVACVKFLLNNHICDYVLTERFCQDPLENYFGRQRSMGARKDNPSVRDVGYNDNTIRNQKIFRPIQASNVGGADKGMIELSDEPFPFRKKSKH